MPRSYPPEFSRKVLDLLEAGRKVPDVYRMLAKPLGGPAPGERPVVVDPIDL